MMEIALVLLKKFWPYLVALALGGAIGGKVAWTVQGVRLDAAKDDYARIEADFDQYKAEQVRLAEEAKRVAETQRAEAAATYAKLKGELTDEIAKGEIYRRCVAAGKCGALVIRVPVQSADPQPALPAAGGTDAASPDAILAARQPAAEVVNDCAATTLMLNQLQADIEAQRGY